MRAFVVVPPGLEAIGAEELAELGLAGEVEEGGITVEGSLDAVYAISLHSRVASRVLIRLGYARAESLATLADGVRNLGWRRWVHPRQPVEVHVTQRGRLHHGDVVEKKVQHAVADALRRARPSGRPPREPAGVWVRVDGERAEISVDASGELLHRRGWAQHRTEAPLRENLAAAVLRASGWSPGETLVDPMCGSGTLLIEAATLLAGKPPGLRRSFAFERFPEHDAARWTALKQPVGPLPVPARLFGSDIDPAAIRAAKANADRAGVRVAWSVADLRGLTPPDAPKGWIVTNPPYGERLAPGTVKALLGEVGAALRSRFGGWSVAVVLPPQLLHALKLPLEPVARFSNGGLRVVCAAGAIPT